MDDYDDHCGDVRDFVDTQGHSLHELGASRSFSSIHARCTILVQICDTSAVNSSGHRIRRPLRLLP
jgi:hypothetical protein